MAYTALYRKFRPDNFSDVKGQDAIVRTLSNQIKSDRIGHAYLFCGTRGTGKTSVAKVFARAINCENPKDGSPCNECAVCRSILDGSSMNVAEIDAASNNSVDNVRQIVEEVKYSPTEGKYRVYIIDEVHMLSSGAFNALLKTLEEPPGYVVFILATTEVNKIPITILSRCQRYDFRRISSETICERLRELCDKEGIEADEPALKYIARLGEGSMRDALSLLERCAAFYYKEKLDYDKIIELLGTSDISSFSKLLRYISAGDVGGCMEIVDELVALGRDLSRYIVDFTWYMRNLLLAKTGRNIAELLEMSSEQLKLLMHESEAFESEELLRYIGVLSELTNRLRFAVQKRIIIETELIRLCVPRLSEDEPAWVDRVRRLENELDRLKAGGYTPEKADDAAPTANEVPEEEINTSELPEALLSDISAIAENWRSLCGRIDSPLLSNSMIMSKPGIDSDGRLKLPFNNIVDYGLAVQKKDEIKEAIEKIVGKSFDFDIVAPGKQEKTKDIYTVADELKKKLGINIDVI